jgi:hypothetical protein
MHDTDQIFEQAARQIFEEAAQEEAAQVAAGKHLTFDKPVAR